MRNINGVRRASVFAFVSLGLGGCALEGLSEKISDYEVPEVTEEWYLEATETVAEALRALFPELSEDEILELSTSLSFDEVVTLRSELEEARLVAVDLTRDLSNLAIEATEVRGQVLSERDGGFPEGLHVHGKTCQYSAQTGTADVLLSGIFSGAQAVDMSQAEVSVLVNGQAQAGTLSCAANGETVDIVLLVDVTGSMGGVIASVRDSVVRFVNAIEESGVQGTISVVTFQDSVAVNVPFQTPIYDTTLERSPFYKPVSTDDEGAIEELRAFVNRLEANQGADRPENLSGAIDFARNNIIGTRSGAPNVVDGKNDPAKTQGFPALTSERQIFVAITDATFHADSRDESNSSLASGFRPRSAADILGSLRQTGSTVHVIDPSWVDASEDPKSAAIEADADYWAIQTGGVGEDTISGYSITDLEVLITSEETGLLDVVLDSIISTSCQYRFEADLSAALEVELNLEFQGELYSEFVGVVSF